MQTRTLHPPRQETANRKRRLEMMSTPLYAIMDQRAYHDVDRAMIMSMQSDQETLDDLRHERDQYWPGYPIVNLATWEIFPE